MNGFIYLLTWFVISVGLIITLTAKWKVHPFFALLLACFVMGTGTGMPVVQTLNTVKEGFGNIMRSLGLIIVLGTSLGVLLEKNGSTLVMARCIQRWLGSKRPALSMSVTGLIVGIPIFCDSGFIVLSGLNKTFARQTGASIVTVAVSMATGLYAVHCLVPPHPGAAAAAAVIGVDYGKLVLYGVIVAVPAALVAYLYAVRMGRKDKQVVAVHEDAVAENENLPSATASFLPVIVPILLITAKAFVPATTILSAPLAILGDPVMALAAGVLLAMAGLKKENAGELNHWLAESVEKAAGILVIIGAGGAFGAVLGAVNIGKQFSEVLPLASMGLAFPFLLTFLLKTAQGSSTVAIITAASIVQPLLPVLGFDTPESKMYCLLAMGSGSMMISHANDAYFWVISKFERISMQPMLRVYSVATILMGLTSFAVVYLLYLFS